jgi:[protein-PII] uridylyltransferase
MQKEIELLRRKFRKGRSELFHQVTWTSPCRDLLEAHASLIDGLLREIYDISCHSADLKASPDNHSGLAIVATGGYGRRELNPYSDIDIAFIPSEEEDPWVEAVVHTAFKLVMDVFLSLRDVRVGYSFRPIAEASSWDISTKTALLDLRYICGDWDLSDELGRRIREVLSPFDLMAETQTEAFGNRGQERTIYLVEPNLKEGPGSLRSLNRARWMFKLLLDVEDDALERMLRDRRLITNQQIFEIREAADWFLRARTWLHLKAGKLSDVLITNYQDRIARELGDCSAQTWLSRHLAHSETLARFQWEAVQALLKGPMEINEVLVRDGFLHLPRDPSSPDPVMSMFHLFQRYSIPVSLRDLKQLGDGRQQALEILEPSAGEAWIFNEILGENRNVAATLRALSEFGFLDRFIPKFSETMRFVPPDPAHRYTVGEHSLRIIEHLEKLRVGKDNEGRRFTDLLNHCPHFDMLCLAALLHDTGKLLPGEHSETSANLAKSVAIRLKLAPEKREILDLLIRRHLLLVRTTRLLDLQATNVIQRIAQHVPSLEALRHLYVFTYVDTCAVSENSWTSMDMRDLEELYRKMQDFYEGSTDEFGADGVQEDKGLLIRKKLAALHGSKKEAAVLKHCDSMPAGYVLNTPLGEIAFHVQLLDRLEAEKAVLDVYNRPGDDFSELTLCTYDDPKPGMLAKITGVLYGCNADINRAQVFTMERKQPVVLDTLWIRSNGMQISESRARRIRKSLKDVLLGSKTVKQFLEEAGKNPPKGIALDHIDLRNDLSEEHTVVHIVAQDLQGLLYLMTRGISQCGLDIHSAKVATGKARAENNFYVTSPAGGQIPDGDLAEWTDRIAHVLKGPEADPPKLIPKSQ